MPNFADRTARSQVLRLRRHAEQILPEYGLEGARLTLCNHGFNTTFRVDVPDGRRFALRINVNSKRSPAELVGEVAWIEALAKDTDVWVPRPLRARTGEAILWRPFDELERELPAVAYSWLPGPNVGSRIGAAQARAMGEALAAMHRHSASWQPPSGSEFQPIDDCLFGVPEVLPELAPHIDAGVFREVVSRANAALDKLRRQPPQPIHADLHMWNVKWHGGRLAVFDFDDKQAGWPMVDAFVTMYYLRGFPRAIETAFWEGLGTRPSDHGLTDFDFEALVASRTALLANDLLTTENPELAAECEGYLAAAEFRLRNYLSTGFFDRSQPVPKP